MREAIVNINITKEARARLDKALVESDFHKPAVRVVFSGFG